jgi:hypothetical protein
MRKPRPQSTHVMGCPLVREAESPGPHPANGPPFLLSLRFALTATEPMARRATFLL